MTYRLSPERVRALIRGMAGVRVLVVGDLMLDRFLWGAVDRISPEAPVPVVQLIRESAVLGGAGNVARNLQTLGAKVDLVGMAGSDRGGEDLVSALKLAGIDNRGVVTVPRRPTTVKTRVIAHQQQVVRIDRETREPLAESIRSELLRRVLDYLPGARALILSDYDKGMLAGDLIPEALSAARKHDIPAVVDPKPVHYEQYKSATVITPNIAEARSMAGAHGREEADILTAGTRIRDHLDCEAVLLTRGEAGVMLFQRVGPPAHIPATAREVFDVTGAGDTVVAALTLALTAGASLLEASILANAAGGCAVGKLGTAVVSPEELEQACA